MIKASGNGKLKRQLKAAGKGARRDLKRGVTRAALFAQGDAQKRTPVDTNTLRPSAKTKIIEKKHQVIAEISFNTNYAIYVHEDLNARHTNGEAKYLENALRQNKAKLQRIIRAELKDSYR